ncbi:hypothetical protein [Bradyrhizobium sp. OHSU_III]|jgi:hypothetical protein|uniref:hypothetical protein n=1 Tax=Bradyrhizobium sp. OHSU_III TaxID=1297865 RepID=UPI0003FCDF7B|nr:hypothetical protein [Bradyrhizobium sp. OHSU_III]OCX30179.1 hypothetical protein QU42_14190 [Bradyrhizobium sp. UASWS1016]
MMRAVDHGCSIAARRLVPPSSIRKIVPSDIPAHGLLQSRKSDPDDGRVKFSRAFAESFPSDGARFETSQDL